MSTASPDLLLEEEDFGSGYWDSARSRGSWWETGGDRGFFGRGGDRFIEGELYDRNYDGDEDRCTFITPYATPRMTPSNSFSSYATCLSTLGDPALDDLSPYSSMEEEVSDISPKKDDIEGEVVMDGDVQKEVVMDDDKKEDMIINETISSVPPDEFENWPISRDSENPEWINDVLGKEIQVMTDSDAQRGGVNGNDLQQEILNDSSFDSDSLVPKDVGPGRQNESSDQHSDPNSLPLSPSENLEEGTTNEPSKDVPQENGCVDLEKENEQLPSYNVDDVELWLPPDAEDTEEESNLTVANNDDDDDDNYNGVNGQLERLSSLGSLEEYVSGFRAKDEKRKAMLEVMHEHFRLLVTQLMLSEGIELESSEGKTWKDLVAELSWEAALLVRPNAEEGREMDPGGYVKVKCIATGHPSESKLVNGLVFKKNAAHKHMPTTFKNPRLLLFRGVLGTATSGLSSMALLTEKGKDDIKFAQELVEATNPNVVLVEKSVARDVQEFLQERKITLAFDMKLSRLERIARCIGSNIASSVDKNINLRQCDYFHIDKLVEEHEVAKEAGKPIKKTLMFFEGCPNPLGCTILLKGASSNVLKRIKRVIQYAVFAAYHLKLETSFLVDERASLPVCKSSSLPLVKHAKIDGSAIDIDTDGSSLPQNESHGTERMNYTDGAFQNGALKEEVRVPHSISLPVRLDEMAVPEFDAHATLPDKLPEPLLVSEDNGKYQVSSVIPQQLDTGFEEQAFLPGFPTQLPPTEADPDGSLKLIPPLDNKDAAIRNEGMLADITHEDPPASGSASFLQTNNEATERNCRVSALGPKMILVLRSTNCITKDTACERSYVSRIKYYGSFDKTIGKFLRDHLLNPGHQCSVCTEAPDAHVCRYAHPNGRLTIRVRRLPEDKQLPGKTEGNIWLWNRCFKCGGKNGIPKPSQRVLMSKAADNLSFGKFLELNFSNRPMNDMIANCGHSLKRDCLRFYGIGTMVTMFTYSPVEIYEVRMPPYRLQFHNPNGREWLKTTSIELIAKGDMLFTDVTNHLMELQGKISSSEASVRFPPSVKDLADVEKMLNAEMREFEANLDKVMAANGQLELQTVHVEMLKFNHMLWELMLQAYVWDCRLQYLCAHDNIKDDSSAKKNDDISAILGKKEDVIPRKLEKNHLHEIFKVAVLPGGDQMVALIAPSVNSNSSTSGEAASSFSSSDTDSQLGIPFQLNGNCGLADQSSAESDTKLAEEGDENAYPGHLLVDGMSTGQLLAQNCVEDADSGISDCGAVDHPVQNCLMERMWSAKGTLGEPMDYLDQMNVQRCVSEEQLQTNSNGLVDVSTVQGSYEENCLPIDPHPELEAASTCDEEMVQRDISRTPELESFKESSVLSGEDLTVAREPENSLDSSLDEKAAPVAPLDHESPGIWFKYSELSKLYAMELKNGYFPNFGFLRTYNPRKLESAEKLISEEGSRLHFIAGDLDNVVSIYENELSSVIACALTKLHSNGSSSVVHPADDFKRSQSALQIYDINSQSSLTFHDGIPHRSRSSISSFESAEKLSEALSSDEFFTAGYEAAAAPLLFSNVHPEVLLGDERSGGKAKYSVVCVFADQFLALRRKCCPVEINYISSLSRCKKWDAQGGKSKVFFAKTLDDRFIVKQVKRTEFDSFMKFGPDYFKYISESSSSGSQTCLAKILGLYQVSVRHPKSSKELRMDVVVMENLLFGKNISRKYDLKGALHARFTADTKDSGSVLLDQNMMRDMLTSPLFVGKRANHRLQRAIWNDTSFLHSINVMDYSMLVGVDDHGHELVFGIIDYMRQYTWDKQLETWVKSSLVVPKNSLPTVISPREYKKRFRKAMSTYFLTVPDASDADLSTSPCHDGSGDSSS